jgi:hypothetical protein
MQTPDLRKFLDSWPYDPNNNVRLTRIGNGREIMIVRQPTGLEQYEVEGRPDGQRPYGLESVLEFQLGRLAAARRADAEDAFRLSAADCAELFDEGMLYYYRFVSFFRLKDWFRAERDTARNLRLVDLAKRYAEHEEDRVRLEQWRPDITCMNAVARAMVLLEKGQYDEALQLARHDISSIEGIHENRKNPHQLANGLIEKLRECLAIRMDFRPREESVFIRQGDYWTITYRGQIGRLHATRGLQCLALLLRNPGRELHVSELVAVLLEIPVLGEVRSAGLQESVIGVTTAKSHGSSSSPILDARAKAEYRSRLQDLRKDLEEAQGFGDQGRTARAQEEMNSIAEELTSAIGLGGRDRRTGAHAERARSAVTKRIKESIKRIAEVLPFLGHHLGARIKTGYFCSYNPHPDRPVAWKF